MLIDEGNKVFLQHHNVDVVEGSYSHGEDHLALFSRNGRPKVIFSLNT